MARVLLIGLGDLGRRLALGLAAAPEVGELVLAGRREEDGRAFAALAAACGRARVRFVYADAAQEAELEALLRKEQPQLVVQAASGASPWAAPGSDAPAAQALLAAGFAAQLPAHLPLVRHVMRAVRASGLAVPVVNAAFPDFTHSILAAEGLAPTVGIGNAGMIRARVVAELRRRGEEELEPRLKVLAHHAHLTPVVLAQPLPEGCTQPRIYIGEDGQRRDELAFSGPPLPSRRELNALPAASGLPILRALLGGPELRTSAPGPGGLPGGYPVRVSAAGVELDLPAVIDLEEALAYQWESARVDGVERLDADGTVHFTAAARRALEPFAPALTEPLAPGEAEGRLGLLRQLLGSA
ncbi:MAG: hypothetical protein SX243_00985 [Acidobacteriota bacterium]|nr:hypothetical protein [Acidobacteriota bacterium]